MEMQEVKGVTYSVEHYNKFAETGDLNYFEEIIDMMILDGISGMNDTFRNAIRGLSRDKKRMTILSLLDKDLNLFKRIKALTDKNIGKMDHIKDIITMLREYVKVGEVEKKKFGEVMTPLELVKEMLATLPEEVWSNPNLKWLDPANGTGPYPIMVIYKLMKGLESWEPDAEKRYKHIVENMIYVCELQPKNMFLYMCAVDPFDTYKLNIYTGSFLEGVFDKHMKDVWGVEKFDVVIGNPPYQDENKSQVKLWPLFINKSIHFLNEGGSLLKVFPSVWINRPGGQKFKKTTKLFSIYQLEKVVIESKEGKKWFDIGETVCFIHLVKNKNQKDTTFIEGEKKLSIKYTADRIVLDETEKLLNKIIDKVNAISLVNGKYTWYEDLHHNDSKETMISDGRLKKTKGEESDAIIWYTASQMFYTNNNNVCQSWRVIVNLSGYYFKEDTVDKYMKITNNEGCTSGMRSILCENKQSAENLFSILSSNLYRFYNDFQKTSGFNTFVFNFPKIENKKWSNNEIYDYFKLNEEEVMLVENFIS